MQALEQEAPPEKIFVPGNQHYPLDCASHSGHINRICEHCSLLAIAYSQEKETVALFEHALTNVSHLTANYLEHPQKQPYFVQEAQAYLQQMFQIIQPLIFLAKDDENLLFFLLKCHREIAQISHPQALHHILNKMHPDGLESILTYLCDRFHVRGFALRIPEVKDLIFKIQHDLPA